MGSPYGTSSVHVFRCVVPGGFGSWSQDRRTVRLSRRHRSMEEEDRITKTILEKAWDPNLQALTQQLGGGGGLDASLLSLPLRRVIPADHPKMIATIEAIRQHLDAGNGLLYRYRIEESPDGLPDKQGAFLLCSFCLVDNLTALGRLDEAMSLYDSLCGRASRLGLF